MTCSRQVNGVAVNATPSSTDGGARRDRRRRNRVHRDPDQAGPPVAARAGPRTRSGSSTNRMVEVGQHRRDSQNRGALGETGERARSRPAEDQQRPVPQVQSRPSTPASPAAPPPAPVWQRRCRPPRPRIMPRLAPASQQGWSRRRHQRPRAGKLFDAVDQPTARQDGGGSPTVARVVRSHIGNCRTKPTSARRGSGEQLPRPGRSC